MARRAYRINKIEYESNPTFNTWENNDLFSFLRDNASSGDENMFEVHVETLEEAIEKFPGHSIAIKKDIEWAVSNDKEYVMYQVY